MVVFVERGRELAIREPRARWGRGSHRESTVPRKREIWEQHLPSARPGAMDQVQVLSDRPGAGGGQLVLMGPIQWGF